MSFKNFLVAYNGTDSAVAALRCAASMAQNNDAHVTAVLAHSTHEVVNSRAAWVPREATKITDDANAGSINEIEAGFEKLRGTLGLADRLQFKRVPGRVDYVLSECAQVHDVLVVGQDQSREADPHISINKDRIALMSGRPILVIPKDYTFNSRPRSAVVAWDGGRAAARAMSDAMKLLAKHESVTVITVGDLELARPIEEVIGHLALHRIKATHEALKVKGSVAQTVLDYCGTNSPGLLVMGAYEHSKFQQNFFGGVTSRVLVESPGPVLLSH